MSFRMTRSTAFTAGLALAAICAAPALRAEGPAATEATTAASMPVATFSPTASPFTISVPNPTRDVRYMSEGVSSSEEAIVAADPAASLAGERDSLGDDAGQPPPGRRRTYGRSRYQDKMHNADGSTKIAFMAGAGMNIPVGNTGKYYTPHFAVGGGAGINFNKTFGILGEFQYNRMGLTGGAINTEYNNLLAVGATPDNLVGFDANAHIISFTVNPVISWAPGRRGGKWGGYVTGGAGWYRKTTNFTLPSVGTACNSFFCQSYVTSYNVDQASADTFGFNFGGGLTYKLSEFSSERLFIDARYTWLPISSTNNQDFFPFNRRNTETIPVLVGIRF